MKNNEYKNLGCANSWAARIWTKPDGTKHVEKEDTTPAEYKACVAAGHNRQAVRSATWSCYTYYHCDICKIQYEVDSSG